MMATGERIGESLAVTWRDLDQETGEIDCSHQIQRIRGKGLVRRRVKSAAGDRIVVLPPWALEMLLARWTPGTSLEAPIFPGSNGGFRDPHNVQHPASQYPSDARPSPRSLSQRPTIPSGRPSAIRTMTNGYPLPVDARSHCRRMKASPAACEYVEGTVVINGM
jgi:integrase